MRVLINVDQAFLNMVQSLFKAENVQWWHEDGNGDVKMEQIPTGDLIKTDANGDPITNPVLIPHVFDGKECFDSQGNPLGVTVQEPEIQTTGVKYISYDKAIGRFEGAEQSVQDAAIAVLEDTANGGIAKVITDPDNCPQVVDFSLIKPAQ